VPVFFSQNPKSLEAGFASKKQNPRYSFFYTRTSNALRAARSRLTLLLVLLLLLLLLHLVPRIPLPLVVHTV